MVDADLRINVEGGRLPLPSTCVSCMAACRLCMAPFHYAAFSEPLEFAPRGDAVPVPGTLVICCRRATRFPMFLPFCFII